jgi:hypothetical protein
MILVTSTLSNKISGFSSTSSVSLGYSMIAIIDAIVILLECKLQKIGYEMRRKKSK